MKDDRLVELANMEDGCYVGAGAPHISPLESESYGKMMTTFEVVVSILEAQGMHTCTAIKLTHDIFGPAFDGWQMLITRLKDLDPSL